MNFCRTKAKEELRLQIGTLRFDLDVLAAQLPKEERKKAKALSNTFFKKVGLHPYGMSVTQSHKKGQHYGTTCSLLGGQIAH